MTNIWETGKSYYVVLNLGRLKQALGNVLEDVVKYKSRKDGQEWLLEHCMRHVKHLVGNKVAISVQITNTGYVEYERNGETINTEYVLDTLDEEDFQLAMYMFEVDEFLTQAEYDALESVTVSV